MLRPEQNTRLDPEEYFTKQERIGKGSFGEVYKGINNRTKEVVAIKIIDLEEAEDEIEDIQQEITVLSQCDSPFVTKYFGSYLKVNNEATYAIYLCFVKLQLIWTQPKYFALSGDQAVDYHGVFRWRICSGFGKQINIFMQLAKFYASVARLHCKYLSSLTSLVFYTLSLSLFFISPSSQLRPGPLEETYIATILREILKGLEYLHSERKIHRDIKGSKLFHYTSEKKKWTKSVADNSNVA